MNRYTPTRRFAIEVTVRVVVGLLIVASILLLAPGIVWGHPETVQICHATQSETNPWLLLEISHHGGAGHFDEDGFLPGHERDFFVDENNPCPPEVEDEEPDNGDTPPDENGDENGDIPDEEPTPEPTATPTPWVADCLRYLSVLAVWQDGSPMEGVSFLWDGHIEFGPTGNTGIATLEFVPPGIHVVSILGQPGGAYFSESTQEVTITEACDWTNITFTDPPAPDRWMMTALLMAGGYLLIVAATLVWVFTGWQGSRIQYSKLRRRR